MEFRESISFALISSCDIFSGVSCVGLKVNLISFSLFFESLSLRLRLTGDGSVSVCTAGFTTESLDAMFALSVEGIGGSTQDIVQWGFPKQLT